MTTDLPAGRELDAAVATQIMGLERFVSADNTARGMGIVYGWRRNGVYLGLDIPAYSDDIAAAWLVVERMQANGYYVTIMTGPNNRNRVAVEWFDPARPDQPRAVVCEAPTAPLAICRAALAAAER